MAENQKLRQDVSELRALVHTSQAGKFVNPSIALYHDEFLLQAPLLEKVENVLRN